MSMIGRKAAKIAVEAAKQVSSDRTLPSEE
jgi:hypothetical protein